MPAAVRAFPSPPDARSAAGTPSTGAAADQTGSEVSHGLEPNVAGALAYFLGVVTGVVFLLIEADDQFVRFHAAQSTVVFGGLIVIMIVMSLFTTFLGFGGLAFGLIGFLLSILSFVVWVGALILWVYLMAKAYQGETPRIPVAAGIADDLV